MYGLKTAHMTWRSYSLIVLYVFDDDAAIERAHYGHKEMNTGLERRDFDMKNMSFQIKNTYEE